MKRRVILSIHDDGMTIGDAFDLLSALKYDSSGGWERSCYWKMSDGHCISVDIARNKGSICFDIWKEKE